MVGHPRVRGVVAAVAHHPQLAPGHQDRPERLLPRRRPPPGGSRHRARRAARRRRRTRLLVSQHCTVCPPTAITRLTKSFSSGGARPITDPSSCRPLQQPVRGLRDGELGVAPAVGAAEDDDVAGLRIAEPVAHLVDEHAVVHAAGAAVQGGLHRARGDHVHLGQERLDEEGQQQRDDDEHRQLAPEPRPAAPARARGPPRSEAAVAARRPLVGRPPRAAPAPPDVGVTSCGRRLGDRPAPVGPGSARPRRTAVAPGAGRAAGPRRRPPAAPDREVADPRSAPTERRADGGGGARTGRGRPGPAGCARRSSGSSGRATATRLRHLTPAGGPRRTPRGSRASP